jgi:two-component system, LytTR family, response regulator
MKILIIDNEADLRLGLKESILKCSDIVPDIEEAEGVLSGIGKISIFQPDIVFLDIEMEDGTGFDLLSKLNNPGFQLIFTTAHNQYAIQAFKFSAIDYLLKPIDREELQICLQKAYANINKTDLSKQLGIMMQQLFVKQEEEKKIVLNDKQTTYFIRLSDIIFCEAEGPYTKFYIDGSNPILISRNLKEYEELLVPMGFIRTHHSYIANPKKIKLYDKTDGGALILEGGFSIPLSQRRKELVMQLLVKK